MAEFIPFAEQNDVLRAAPGTEDYVNDLPIYRQPSKERPLQEGERPCVVSCFQLSPEELAEVNRTGGLIYHMVLGYTHAPVSVYGISPFTQPAPAEQG